ncbi:hypothetical protein J6590_087663 [Homalodisca vitripennis]|nr:hypothetical protein J6590_087663 [Homalodisca vitripennis]
MLLHRTPVCINVSVDPHQNTALENFDSLGWCAEVHLNTAGDDRGGCCGRNKHFNCYATTLLSNSQINPNRQICDVQKARARPNDPTGEGGSHRTPGVALAVVYSRTSHHTAAAVHSFSTLHPSFRGPDDGRGVPIVTHPHVDLLARVNFVSSITG